MIGSPIAIQATKNSLGLSLPLLQKTASLRIKEFAQISTIENLEGRFRRGTVIQRIDQKDTEVGISLGITPRLKSDGAILLFVDFASCALDETNECVIGTDMNGNAIFYQPVNTARIQTTVEVNPTRPISIIPVKRETASDLNVFKLSFLILSLNLVQDVHKPE